MRGREVAVRMSTFLALLYAVFMAIFGAMAIGGVILIRVLSHDLDHALARLMAADGRAARWGRALATAPAAVAPGVSGALRRECSETLRDEIALVAADQADRRRSQRPVAPDV